MAEVTFESGAELIGHRHYWDSARGCDKQLTMAAAWCSCGFRHQTVGMMRAERVIAWHNMLAHRVDPPPGVVLYGKPPVVVRDALAKGGAT